jgi:hypothetical protein
MTRTVDDSYLFESGRITRTVDDSYLFESGRMTRTVDDSYLFESGRMTRTVDDDIEPVHVAVLSLFLDFVHVETVRFSL